MVEEEGLDTGKLTLAIPYPEDYNKQRSQIVLGSAEKLGTWEVKSLRTLFRGDRKALAQTAQYPKEYVPFFAEIEQAIVSACDSLTTIPVDAEFMEFFNTMRRRPDGKSQGYIHDMIWQAACLGLGKYVYSAAEYEAMFRQLTRSARSWKTGHTSRNYIPFLRQQFG